jgi:hypothetical protein
MKTKTTVNEDNYLRLYYDIPYEGSTSAGKPLKKMRNITCPYRGIKIISGTALKPFEKGLALCQTVQECVELLSDYTVNLLDTEKSIYAILKDFAALNPDDNVQNCLQMLYTTSLIRLKLEEFCVLDDVDKLSCKLSPTTALKLREKTTHCRQLILSDNKKDTFKRKTFLNSLEEIQVKENEREIFGDIKNKALFLPTSGSSKHAFIVKYASRTQTETIRRIFIASTGSIEHIIPQSLGGLNTIGNFLWTSASGNRFRENMPLLWYIKRFPKIPNYAQLYIDDVIREIHNGKLEGNETYPYRIKQKLLDASEGRILISLAGYNYSEDEAAQAEKEFHYRWEKYKLQSNKSPRL